MSILNLKTCAHINKNDSFLTALRKDIITKFSNDWNERLDEAHRQEHFDDVYETGLHINEVLGLGQDPKLIMFVAYFHDLFCDQREIHHELSGRFIMETRERLIERNLTLCERKRVASACEEHRASFKGNFSYILSELMNSADRGQPKPVTEMIDRAIAYRKSKFPHDSKKESYQDYLHRIIDESISHIKEKYGRNGYARYTDMYKKVFGEELENMYNEIDNL